MTNLKTVSIGKLATAPQALTRSVQQSKAVYQRLGSSGLRVSNPILGGLSLGSSKYFPWILDEGKALPLLKAAYDRGINTWDTANVYSNGESERLFGKALSVYNIPRRKVVLMTKCYRVVADDENYDPGLGITMQHETADKSKDYVNQWGLSRAAIFNAVQASLERLNTHYIDVLQIHRYDETVDPKETMQALHDLVRSGTVRYIGASSMWTYQFATLQHVAEKNGWTPFVSMQNHYNLLYRHEELEMNPFCRQTNVGLIPWAPFASGRLVRSHDNNQESLRSSISQNGSIYEDASPDSRTIISRVREVAAERGWPPSHVSLAWLNRRVTAPIIGFSSIQRMDEALAAHGKTLSPDEESYLEEAYRPKAVQGHS